MQNREMRLTALIRNIHNRSIQHDLSDIPIDIQHVAEVDVAREVEREVEQEIAVHQNQPVASMAQELGLEETPVYNGERLGFDAFSEPAYKDQAIAAVGDAQLVDHLYGILEQELFANLQHAIQYVSPSAAKQLALNLPILVTLNKKNLPHGFILKHAEEGAFVLDYDHRLKNNNANAFTPVITDAIASVCGQGETLLNQENVIKRMRETKVQPEIITFVSEKYLSHFPCWDHFSDNASFFDSLKKMDRYSKGQFKCLRKFLERTGCSRYDLPRALQAFDEFWYQFGLLCDNQDITIERINQCHWTTPEGGDPGVYMERMLAIFKNARSLDDQLRLLAIEGINLDNYGPYYASDCEGFKVVCSYMRLCYDAKKQNSRAPNQHLYRVEFDQLVARVCTEENPDKTLIVAIFRFFGMQPAGIMLHHLLAALADLNWPRYPHEKINTMLTSDDSQQDDLLKNFITMLFGVTFFASHDAYLNNVPEEIGKYITHQVDCAQGVTTLLSELDSCNRLASSLLKKTFFEALATCYNRGIKLNQMEGLMLVRHALLGMLEYQTLANCEESARKQVLAKLFMRLKENKYAVCSFLSASYLMPGQRGHNVPLIYALNTVEMLEQDERVAAAYHDDLLTLAFLMNAPGERHKIARGDIREDEFDKNLKGVKAWLREAIDTNNPNLRYAIQRIIDAKTFFSPEKFILACKQIEQLSVCAENEKTIVDILKRADFELIPARLPKLFSKSNETLRTSMIQLLAIKNDGMSDGNREQFKKQMNQLTLAELQAKLAEMWKSSGLLLTSVGEETMHRLLVDIKDAILDSSFADFSLPDSSTLSKTIFSQIKGMPDFNRLDSFKKIDQVEEKAKTLSALFKKILENPHVEAKSYEFSKPFSTVDFSKLSCGILYSLLTLLTEMPRRDYLSLIKILFNHSQFMGSQQKVESLLNLLRALNSNGFHTVYFGAISQLFINTVTHFSDNDEKIKGVNLCFARIIHDMVDVFNKDNQDPVLQLLLVYCAQLTSEQVEQMLLLSKDIASHRHKLNSWFAYLIQNKALDNVLQKFMQLYATHGDKVEKVLTILSQGHIENRTNQPANDVRLINLLVELHADELDAVFNFYKNALVSASSLLQMLEARKTGRRLDFYDALKNLEKEPFGERNVATLEKQFCVSEVARVVNTLQDMKKGSAYDNASRERIKEAFTSVNAMGRHLAVYGGKAAKDLTNQEIQTFFAALKNKDITGSDPAYRHLLALGLIREAMYRGSSQFPNSTQMIAVIDAMFHQGHYIANIDTGQGKSLSDVMKAALLWLDADRVDVATSSLVDAKRDLDKYGLCLQLLGIPYSQQPITALSQTKDFKKTGINFGTVSQLSLFFAKSAVYGETLATQESRVSLILNESDYAILDDRTINRFAMTDDAGIPRGQEWIYAEINAFVSNEAIDYAKSDTTNDETLVAALRDFLTRKANDRGRSDKIIAILDNKLLFTLLKSVLDVQYRLKEYQHYIVEKAVNTTEDRYVVKVLDEKTGRVMPGATFGNGMHPLLCAKLNQGGDYRYYNCCPVEPQSETIIATNNKNFIDYYARQGVIWGSSGTVGSASEIDEQSKKYGMAFTKIASHQVRRVEPDEFLFAEDAEQQYHALIAQLTKTTGRHVAAPAIIFCKNIEFANALYRTMSHDKRIDHNRLQRYTGGEGEVAAIQAAAKPGMITITTSALSRNTDIPYDREVGCNVYHMFADDSERGSHQKSGRAGREGSPGAVYFIFNKQELGGHTKEHIVALQKKASVDAANQRRANEKYYDMMGDLREKVDLLPDDRFPEGKKAFWQKHWAKFSAESEARFRAGEGDINQTLTAFNQMQSAAGVINPLTEVSVLQHAMPIPVINEPVMNNPTGNTSQADQQATVAVCKGGIKQFLNNNAVQSTFSERWFSRGHIGHLNQMASNNNDLWKLNDLVVHAFKMKCNDQSIVELQTIKNMMFALLDEYLATSWFVNNDRKQRVAELKEQIRLARSREILIDCLSRLKENITAQQNVAASNQRFCCFFGPGRPSASRCQATLDRALNLAAALSGELVCDTDGRLQRNGPVGSF